MDDLEAEKGEELKDLEVSLKNNTQYMVDYLNKGKNLKIKPIDLSNKNKCMAYCSKLPFGILYHSSSIDLEKIKIVFSIVKKKMNINF